MITICLFKTIIKESNVIVDRHFISALFGNYSIFTLFINDLVNWKKKGKIEIVNDGFNRFELINQLMHHRSS
jgi:hypothetical protein